MDHSSGFFLVSRCVFPAQMERHTSQSPLTHSDRSVARLQHRSLQRAPVTSIRSLTRWRHAPSITPVAMGKPAASRRRMQKIRILQEIVCTLVDGGTLVLRQTAHRCTASHASRHVRATPAPQQLEPCRHSRLALRCTCWMQGPRRFPQVLQDMDQIEHDAQCHPIRRGCGIQQAQLRQVAIDERHPLLRVLGIRRSAPRRPGQSPLPAAARARPTRAWLRGAGGPK